MLVSLLALVIMNMRCAVSITDDMMVNSDDTVDSESCLHPGNAREKWFPEASNVPGTSDPSIIFTTHAFYGLVYCLVAEEVSATPHRVLM